MRSSNESTDTLGTLPSKSTAAPAPAPAPKARQVSEHVVEVDGRFETRDYPNTADKKPGGWPFRLTDEQLTALDAWGC